MSHPTNKTRLYEALGQIAVSFHALEQALEAIIFCCMQASPVQVRILMSSLSFSTKVTTLESLLCELHSGEEFTRFSDTLQELIARCLFCEQMHDDWICSFWIPELDVGVGMVRRLRSQKESDSELTLETVDLAELEGFILCLGATVTYLQSFHLKIFSSFDRLRGPEHCQCYLRARLQAENEPF